MSSLIAPPAYPAAARNAKPASASLPEMNPRRASIEAELALIEGAREQRAREAVAALRAERAQQESVRVEIEAAGGERRKALDPLSASVQVPKRLSYPKGGLVWIGERAVAAAGENSPAHALRPGKWALRAARELAVSSLSAWGSRLCDGRAGY